MESMQKFSGFTHFPHLQCTGVVDQLLNVRPHHSQPFWRVHHTFAVITLRTRQPFFAATVGSSSPLNKFTGFGNHAARLQNGECDTTSSSLNYL
jgi:hypothetical protein